MDTLPTSLLLPESLLSAYVFVFETLSTFTFCFPRHLPSQLQDPRIWRGQIGIDKAINSTRRQNTLSPTLPTQDHPNITAHPVLGFDIAPLGCYLSLCLLKSLGGCSAPPGLYVRHKQHVVYPSEWPSGLSPRGTSFRRASLSVPAQTSLPALARAGTVPL